MHDSYEATQRENAKQVLRQLALGLNPIRGGNINHDSVLQNPSVIRALLLGAEALAVNQQSSELPDEMEPRSRIGKVWSPQESNQLRQDFDERMTLTAIAKKHGRTPGAIAARLVHLKLVRDRDEARSLLGFR